MLKYLKVSAKSSKLKSTNDMEDEEHYESVETLQHSSLNRSKSQPENINQIDSRKKSKYRSKSRFISRFVFGGENKKQGKELKLRNTLSEKQRKMKEISMPLEALSSHHTTPSGEKCSVEELCNWLKKMGLDPDGILSKQFKERKLNKQSFKDRSDLIETLGTLSYTDVGHKSDVIRAINEKKTSPSRLHHATGSQKKKRYSMPVFAKFLSIDPSSHPSQTLDECQTLSRSPRWQIGSVKIGSRAEKLEPIILHTNFSESGDYTPIRLMVEEDSTVAYLIQILLDQMNIQGDVNLYSIKEVTYPMTCVSGKEKRRSMMPLSRELEHDESPLTTFKSIVTLKSRHTVRRLEVFCNKGINIKIICRLNTYECSQNIKVSPLSSVGHVMKLAMKCFYLENDDILEYRLCEIQHSGALREIKFEEKYVWTSEYALLLCSCMLSKDDKNQVSEATALSTIDDIAKMRKITVKKSDQLSELNQKWSFSSDDILCDVIEQRENPTRTKVSQKANEVELENSSLRVRVAELNEYLEKTLTKISSVRIALENGLANQRHNQYLYLEPPVCARKIEEEIRNIDKVMYNREELLENMFLRQRNLVREQASENNLESVSQKGKSCFRLADDSINRMIHDIEVEIAIQQSKLLILKQNHQTQNMRLTLHATKHQAEQFRNMVNTNLYKVLCHNQISSLISACEIKANDSGDYDLKLKTVLLYSADKDEEVFASFVQNDYPSYGLLKNDHLIEINGISVQTTASETVFELMKNTKKLRLVIIRQNIPNKNSSEVYEGSETSSGVTDVNDEDSQDIYQYNQNLNHNHEDAINNSFS